MKIPPAHDFIQFRDYHTRLTFALKDELNDDLQAYSRGMEYFRRFIQNYVTVECMIQGRRFDVRTGKVTLSWSLR